MTCIHLANPPFGARWMVRWSDSPWSHGWGIPPSHDRSEYHRKENRIGNWNVASRFWPTRRFRAQTSRIVAPVHRNTKEHQQHGLMCSHQKGAGTSKRSTSKRSTSKRSCTNELHQNLPKSTRKKGAGTAKVTEKKEPAASRSQKSSKSVPKRE